MFRISAAFVALALCVTTAQAQTLVAPPRPTRNLPSAPAETPPPAPATETPSPPPTEPSSPAQTQAPAPAPKHKAPIKRPVKKEKPEKPLPAPDKLGPAEAAARTCIHNRLKELIALDQREDIATDAALRACSDGLRTEMKESKKSYCDAVSYIGWLVSDENNRLNGVQGQPYQPNRAFIQDCSKTESWEKHR